MSTSIQNPPGPRPMIPMGFRIRDACPLQMKRPWTWKNKEIDGKLWVSERPGKIEVPKNFIGHFDWTVIKIRGPAGAPFGTKSMKSIFTTASRFVGDLEVLAHQPDLSPITDAFVAWNERLFRTMPDGSLKYFILGDDVAGNAGLFFSMEVFERWLAPHWERLFEVGRANGAEIIFHSDGDIVELLPWLARNGVTKVLCEGVGRMNSLLMKPSKVPGKIKLIEINPTWEEFD